MKKTLIPGLFGFLFLLAVVTLFFFSSCNNKRKEYVPVCTEFTPECEIQKKWSAIKIASKDSTSYDGFGNPTREGWYLYNSVSKQVFPLSVISLSGTGGNTVPAHNLGEDGAGSMTQPINWGIKWKVEKIQSNTLAFPGIQSQEIEVLCLSGGEISFLQFMGDEVAGKWKKY